jgi:hypothetical protein
MRELAAGFPIDGRGFPWGTTLAAVAANLALPIGDAPAIGYHTGRAACRTAFGFDTLGVEITAAGSTRPVTMLCYELAPPAGADLPSPAVWLTPLTRWLGKPDQAGDCPLPPHGDPAGCVRFHANWRVSGHSVAFSLYGALRDVAGGRSAGCLWLSWSATAAAVPFLDERLAAAADLAFLAAAPVDLRKFTLILAQQPRFRDDADYALSAPHLLPTPKTLKAGLGPHSFAICRIGGGTRWCLSTRWDSIVFEIGQRVVVDWYDVLPAKGGGSSEIAVDGWSVRDVAGSRVIAEALAALGALPGIEVRHEQSYDC